MIEYISDDEFQERTRSGTVLVVFTAAWCIACKKQRPLLEKLEIPVLMIDVDVHQRVAAAYGVMGLPTYLVFQDGQHVQTLTGPQTARTFRDLA